MEQWIEHFKLANKSPKPKVEMTRGEHTFPLDVLVFSETNNTFYANGNDPEFGPVFLRGKLEVIDGNISFVKFSESHDKEFNIKYRGSLQDSKMVGTCTHEGRQIPYELSLVPYADSKTPNSN